MTDRPTAPGESEEPTAGSRDRGPGRRTGSRPSPVRNARTRRGASARSLIETTGPEPDASLADIRLAVGRIAGTHGVRGELKLKLLTDHPEHLKQIRNVFLGEEGRPYRLLGIRLTQHRALIQLEGIDTPEAGKALGGLVVRIVGSDARPLEEDEYFLYQLIGLTVEDTTGAAIGRVTDLLETGAHDVLVIDRGDGRDDLLVPNHPQFVKQVEPTAGRMVIDPPRYDDA